RLTRPAIGILRVVERLAASWADVVITVHEPYRRELVRRGVRTEKLRVVMNSLDESLLPTPLTRKHEGGFRIVYHGTVTPHYGVHLLVEAVAMIAQRVPEARLEIYGDGDAVRGLRASAHELDLQNVIDFEPRFMPQRDVLARVHHAAVGVVPNLPIQLNRYALSSKLFEYVMLGIPVVSADLPTLREYFADDEVLFFKAGDAHALADALVAVATDPNRAVRRAEAARRRYEAYRWPRSAARYRDVLETLSHTPPSP
ncbi:MAG: glycosyltransferase, partial [Actinomycetota bacterium]|nr:glycosyltransferase [Actinomycetota bacterium]